ncbi:DUF6344 domain-containing protein [Streptomyces sp. NPDC018019]|uniref:DUF6344 domain-containing protein n=1 Tax=Streptomyces sp. NPDC018019 TaxID=3365030 RepID=UPI0037BA653E
MAATKVTRLWAAFVVVIVRMLAALGFRTPAAATAAPAPAVGGDGDRTAEAWAWDEGVDVPHVRQERHVREEVPEEVPDAYEDFGYPYARPVYAGPRMLYGRTLPPTMKQRIRAEAHGAAPSSRSVLADAFDAPYAGPVGAPVGAPPVRAAALPSARGAVPAARRPERVLCPA